MVELVFEIVAALNLITGIVYWGADHDDIMHWLFYLLCSAIMYMNAIRYGKDDNE